MSQISFAFEPRFISSLVAIPKEVHSKLVKCLSLLARDPSNTGLNDEPLRGPADGLRSARVDREYRLIYERRSEGELQLLLVAKHDEAYREADRVRIRVAPCIRVPGQAGRSSTGLGPQAIFAEPAVVLCLISPKGRKYLPLTKFLAEQSPEIRRLDLSFAEIFLVISAELPKSAYLYPAWWANDGTHVQAAAWMTVGWKTTELRLDGRRVTFERVT